MIFKLEANSYKFNYNYKSFQYHEFYRDTYFYNVIHYHEWKVNIITKNANIIDYHFKCKNCDVSSISSNLDTRKTFYDPKLHNLTCQEIQIKNILK